MLRKQNILTAGLMVLLTVSGQTFAVAGGNRGGFGGGSHNKPSNHVSNHSLTPRPSFSVQSPVKQSLGNAMTRQTMNMQTQPLLKNQSRISSQPLKLNTVQTPRNFQFPNNLNLGQHGKLGTSATKIGHLPVLPIKNPVPHFPGNIPVGNVNPVNPVKPVFPVKPVLPVKPVIPVKPVFPIKSIIPIKPIPPICPPFGGTQCGNGYGNWGYGYCGGWGWGWGCGNWGYGNYGCGYWPGYFGGCSYPLYPTCSYPIYTPVYFTSTQFVPTTTTIVLNDTAVPPSPAAASTREIDLAVKEMRLVESATADRGALYRVTIVNNGPQNLETASRVALLGFKESQPAADSPRTMETLQTLKVGESTVLDLRMPVEANSQPKLLVAVEIPETYKDTNEANNVAAGEAAQVPQLASMIK